MNWIAVGIDICKDLLDLVVFVDGSQVLSLQLPNTRAGHRRLLERLERFERPVRVGLESTGVYGMDVTRALAAASSIEVMVINPRAARRFAEALGVRAKTDPIDARVLAQYVQRMPFLAWSPPSSEAFELRALTRRMHQVTGQLVREKNRLHAAEATQDLRWVRVELRRSIRFLETSLARMEAQALKVLGQDEALHDDFLRLCSIPGIAQRSALKILAELATLPQDLTSKQLTACAGLDPKISTSGISVCGQPRISKRGNVYLRSALFMPAQSAGSCDPGFRAFHQRLCQRGKKPLLAKVALMRKLLLVAHAVRRDGVEFQAHRRDNASTMGARPG